MRLLVLHSIVTKKVKQKSTMTVLRAHLSSFICKSIPNGRNGNYIDCASQTFIVKRDQGSTISDQPKLMDKQCNTDYCDTVDSYLFMGSFHIKSNTILFEFTGVTFNNFNLLLKKLNNNPLDDSKLSMKDRLYLVLVKIRSGMTFEAMSILFSIDKLEAANIFYKTLHELTIATANLVYWPENNVVRKQLPKCFKGEYSNTRVILDSVIVRTRSPYLTVDDILNRTDSVAGKFLVGITPSGFIGFKSKVVDSNKTDTELAIECGVLDLLEDGDLVVIEDELLELRDVDTDKKIEFIVPPILTENSSSGNCELAKVRMHKVQIMEHLNSCQILEELYTSISWDKRSLYDVIDSIVHICCVLTNLQSPITKDQTLEKGKGKLNL